jgi:6-phosphogluconolactonase/glucosamine-6-phosphate isomerase/deaminase
MEFIRADEATATRALTERLAASLSQDKTLWLVCGGSNIAISVAVMNALRSDKNNIVGNLTVAMTDERYGPVGHANSNWQQLLNSGFGINGIRTIPILTGAPIEDEAAAYAKKLAEAFSENKTAIGQYGIGANGHIAGVFPHSIGVTSNEFICSYEEPAYKRITMTLKAFNKLTAAYALVFGASKHDVVQKFKEFVPLEEMPSQILKQLREPYLYSDQLE